MGPPPPFAVVRFENLTADASVEWLALAASDVLASSLEGALEGPVISPAAVTRLATLRGVHTPSAPGISAQRSNALVAGAKRMITGYFQPAPAGVRFVATDEDLLTGRTLRTFAVEGPPKLETLVKLAKQISPSAHAYLTASDDAVRLYSGALEAPVADAGPALRGAVAADPDFGPPWVMLIRATALAGDKPGAAQVATEALTHKLDKLSAATVRMERADLLSDQAARLAALEEVVELSPSDTTLLRQMAESRTAAGRFTEAAATWKRLSAILPDDPDAWNQMGYTLAWSGDYAAGLAALKHYAQLRPNDPNPPDSMGDVQFMYRKYAEAAASYLQAEGKGPGLTNGGSLYKAGWAKFLAGDKSGAEQTFRQFLEARKKAGIQHLSLLEADWLYRTGRQKEALALLRSAVESETPEMKSVLYAQLVIWELVLGDREAAARDAAAMGQPKTAPAAMARIAAMPSASAAEWEKRVNTLLPGPGLRVVREIALGYSLILDGKKAEAVQVLERVVAMSAPNDFAIRALYSRLKKEQPKLEAIPDAGNLNQFAAVTGE